MIFHVELKMRRDLLRAANLCINGPLPGVKRRRVGAVRHGKVVAAGKCQRCLDVHKAGR